MDMKFMLRNISCNFLNALYDELNGGCILSLSYEAFIYIAFASFTNIRFGKITYKPMWYY